MKILYVSVSPMGDKSITRLLASKLISDIKKKHSHTTVVERDLNKTAIPHLSVDVISAFMTPPDKRDAKANELLTLSDALVKEIFDANLIIIASPMWNFGVPSVLKAWIDNICRAGITFKYTQTGPVGLINGKKAIVISARGGIYSEGESKIFEHEESHLDSVLKFLGITNTQLVHAEGVAYGEEASKNAITKAEAKITDILSAL